MDNVHYQTKYHQANMTMNTLFIIALSIINAPLALTESSEKSPCVMCAFTGTILGSKYKFSVSDVPSRCEVVTYAVYLTDEKTNKDDTDAIASLVSQNKTVYTYVGGMNTSPWDDILNNNESAFIAPMEKFIIDNKIKGIILSTVGVFDGTDKERASKLKTFISRLRADLKPNVSDLKVGLEIMGQDAHSFSNPKLFDFPAVNDELDMIVVDSTTAGYICFNDTEISGRLPIKPTNDSSVISLEHICEGVAGSKMDQNKLILSILIQVTMSNTKVAKDSQISKSYSEYCKRKIVDTECWCADSNKQTYAIMNYAKKYFKGISLFGCDFDDTDNSCGCDKFSVTNTYIDAWESKEMKNCVKIGWQDNTENTNTTQQ